MIDVLKTIPWPIVVAAFFILIVILTICLVTGFRLQLGDKIYSLEPSWRKNTSNWQAKIKAKVYLARDSKPPNHYESEYLRSRLIVDYGPDVQYFVIKYGSSAKNSPKPNDEDYLVILLNYKPDSKNNPLGHEYKPSGLYAKALDIGATNFFNFLICIIMGKPYELSVMQDGILKESWNCDPKIFEWLKVLSTRIVLEPSYIIQQLREDRSFSQAIYDEEAKKDKIDFKQIVAAYHSACCCAQIALLKSIPEQLVPAKIIYPLSQVSVLIQSIDDPKVQESFRYVINCFKLNTIPPDRTTFENHMKLIEHHCGAKI